MDNSCTYVGTYVGVYTYVGTYKIVNVYRMWENFGVGKNWRIWRIEGHSPMFFLGSVLAIRVAHSPIFYPPIDSDQRIRQCFTPPKFSHVR